MRIHGSTRNTNGKAKDELLSTLKPTPLMTDASFPNLQVPPPPAVAEKANAEKADPETAGPEKPISDNAAPEKPIPEISQPTEAPPTDAASALSFVQKTVFTNISRIIHGLITAAAKGNHLPARFLMELAGITPPQPNDPSHEHEESLTQLFLNELDQAKAG